MTRNVKRIAISLTVLSTLILVSCSAKYAAYSNEMLTGKQFLQEKEYEKAKEYFTQASNVQQDSASLALLGVTYYKMGDLANAERTIREAERIDKNSAYYMRILGYKSLILLKQGKPEGFNALRQYVDYVKQLGLPLETHEIEKMIENNVVDLAILDPKIEEQATWYEDENERWKSGEPGYFQQKYGIPL
ncbi:MAG: tetratricopeptide repeat protein [Proteobacteria bacterium]|nr:tetratricopeptide repeat protein [Pseudomonadota bacterium]